MKNKKDIQNELDDIKISLPLVSMPSMQVPEGYFENVASNILAEIHTDEFLNSLPRQSMQVPENYFDTLADNIFEDIHTNAFSASLPKENIFSVPTNYFDNLTEQIVAKSIKENTIRPFSIVRTYYSKMAIAASLIMILGIGFLMISQKNIHTKNNIEAQLAKIPDAEINKYIQEHAYEFDHQLSYQKIDESNIDLKKLENDIYNSYFENISDEELKNYL